MTKRIIAVVLTLILTFGVFAQAEGHELVITKEHEEEKIWEICKKYAPNEEMAASLMSIIRFESGYQSNAFSNYYLYDDEYVDNYTAVLDAGLADGSTLDDFVRDPAKGYNLNSRQGYGLMAWYDVDEKTRLYKYAQEWGTSLGDAEMQVSFVFYDFQTETPEWYEWTLNAPYLEQMAKYFAHLYEGTYMESKLGDRAWFARELYNKYHS